MPFNIVRDDITHMKVDAIVNAANEQLRMGGGVCGAIFRAAGSRKLQAACDEIGHCPTGSAVATPGFELKARYVIHTVGPIWRGGTHGERELLASCYRSSLELADALKCRSIAFPLISAGIYGYPRHEALAVAQKEIRAFLDTHEMEVTLVLYDASAVAIADNLRLQVERYIDDVYVGAHVQQNQRLAWEDSLHTLVVPMEDAAYAPEADASQGLVCPNCGHPVAGDAAFCVNCGCGLGSYGAAGAPTAVPTMAPAPAAAPTPVGAPAPSAAPVFGGAMGTSAPRKRESAAKPHLKRKRQRMRLPQSLKNLLTHLDAGFSETLLALIDERGLTDAQVYKKANLSRQHFSKIRNNPHYQPTKTTVLALAVALELSLDETQMLLKRAGFALSHADCRDVIVEFFIREGVYDIFEINDALFTFDQPLLS